MKTIKILLATFMLAISFLSLVPTSFACSCLPPSAPKDELKTSDAVFAGKVIDIQQKANFFEVTIDVQQAWKGIKNKETTIYTSKDSASCGVNFTKDVEYIIYAHNQSGELHTSLCSRTAELTNAQQDLDELGKGTIPTEPSKTENEHFTTNLSISILVIIGLSSLLMISRRKNNQ